jgi:hypothetical protein
VTEADSHVAPMPLLNRVHNDCEHRSLIEGLGKVSVHAGSTTRFHLFRKSLGRQTDDGDAPT